MEDLQRFYVTARVSSRVGLIERKLGAIPQIPFFFQALNPVGAWVVKQN